MHRNWTELIKPRKVEFAGSKDSQYKASLVLEPLERGFGTTLGNALRRVLLSSLEGAAISAIKVAGAAHAFSTIPGVEEDVTDIILNLKGVVIRMDSQATQTVALNISQPGVVTAGDIECGHGIQILNPNHHIATLKKGGHLTIIMTVTNGKGYMRAISGSGGDDEILLDCSYNPVKNVSYKVFNARIGQQTDYDKLVFDIETNGVISPRSAMALAAKILHEQLSVFINFDDTSILKEKDDSAVIKWNQNLFHKVDDLDLTIRCANCLKSLGIVYVGDLVQHSESMLLKTPNFGRKSLIELKELLNGMELSLGIRLEGWPPENIEEYAKQFDYYNTHT